MTDTAFENLVRPEVERLYRLAFRLTDHRSDAEDLVREALVSAREKRDGLSGSEAPGVWLARILYNRFIENREHHERRRLRVVAGDTGGADEAAERRAAAAPANAGGDEGEDGAGRGPDIAALQAGLAGLSLEQRAVVLMHDAEGYKLEEIYAITGVEVGTLRSRLYRARRRLRDSLARP